MTPKLLKDYSDELIEPLKVLYGRSVDTRDPFDSIDMARIIPIFKSEDKSDPANYRPVALTNHITKIFEKLIMEALVHHLTTQKLYNETQHGFCSSRSTLTIEYNESILLQLETTTAVDSIYLDFSKVFGKCDHNVILNKLQSLGIGGTLPTWIEGFLKLRKQCVTIQGHQSQEVWTK